jgi:hypothetical protein
MLEEIEVYYGGSRHVQDNDIDNTIYILLQSYLWTSIQIQNKAW